MYKHLKKINFKMVRACCVVGCKTRANLPSHRFPHDKNMASQWMKALNLEHLENLPDKELRKYHVCYKHFADDAYCNTYRNRRLKQFAIPAITIEGAVTHGIIYIDSDGNEFNKKTETEANSDLNIDKSDSVKEVNDIMIEQSVMDSHEIQPHMHLEEHDYNKRVVQDTNVEPSEAVSILKSNITFPKPKKRSILGEITRQSKLTPTEKALYEVALQLKKKNYLLQRQLKRLKEKEHKRKLMIKPKKDKKVNTIVTFMG